MKKISSYFLGFAAVALMAACSNEEIAPEADNTILPGVATGEAYLTVRLQDANAMTRAEGDKKNDHDGDYKNGVASEHAVKDAQFFFFDEQGVYVSEASVWNGGVDNPTKDPDKDHESTGNNVEFKGNTVVVLRGVTDKNYPKYLLTVLNANGFKAKATLAETSEALVAWNKAYTEEGGDKDYFVMSTSSYFGTENAVHDNKFYCATKIDPNKFKDEPYVAPTNPSASDDAVQVYVERLAAKVQLTTGADLQKTDKGLYQIKNVSIAGDLNNEGGASEGTMDVYVKFSKWGLNGTVKDSYLSKQLQDEWNTTIPFANWSAANDFRCFWAASTVYGSEPTLAYTSYNKLSSVINGSYDADNFGYAYCNENTNTVDNIIDGEIVDPAKVTSVLIGAQVCNVAGKPLNLVRHNGLLYNKVDYLKYVINAVNTNKAINIYTKKEGAADDKRESYEQIDDTYLDLAKDKKSKEIKAVVKEGAFKADVKYYSLASSNESGVVATEITDPKKALEDYLTNHPSKTLFVVDEAFTDGKMYYNIPIEHLAGFGENKALILGSYGVVRNHWYQVVLNKIENMGTGVFNPDEEIIPETPEQKYYLDATINILSWKVVNQSVDL